MKIARKLAPVVVVVALVGMLVFLLRNDPADSDAKEKCKRITNSVEGWAAQPSDRKVLKNVCNQPEIRNRTCMPAVRVCEKYGFASLKGPE